jgi:hypothetical protein
VKRINSGLSPARWALRWKLFLAAICLIALFVCVTAWELFSPEYFECHHIPQPFTSQQSPNQAVFIARVVATGNLWPRNADSIGEGYPRRYWGLAFVEKTLWGLPWWDRKIVLLTFFVRGGQGFKRGETYFVEGNRQSRRLTRLLPIFEVHCTRTAALKYAEVDLRVLKDGPPKNGVRIIGYTYRHTSANEWKEVPGTKVGIDGPAGETIVTSDPQGIYDVNGLPAGAYDVHGMAAETGPHWAHPICYWMGSQSLKAGDARECNVFVP